MEKKQGIGVLKQKRLFALYIGFLFLLALAIFLMPLGNSMRQNTMWMLYFSGGCFWIGLIGTVIMAWKVNHCRKINSRGNGQVGNWKQVGVFCFFQNRTATAVDVIMFLSLAGFVAVKIGTNQIIVTFLMFAIFVFSFGMHCMLNGINYKYITHKVRREEES